MPTINISLLAGRSQRIKQELAREITDVMKRVLNSSPEDVQVIFTDIEWQNWATGGEFEEFVVPENQRK